MSAVVIYESMFGATRKVAEALARGIGRHTEVTAVNVNEAGRHCPNADLILVGAPTHVHGPSSPTTRDEAVRWSKDPARNLSLELAAPGVGVREWLDELTGAPGDFVAFDTRADAAAFLTGSAARHIQKSLKKAGGHAVAEPESFLVHDNALNSSELERAEALGERLGALQMEGSRP